MLPQESQVSCGVVPKVSREGMRLLVLRWNGQWIGGDRFARDYAAGIASFNAEVVQAVTRFHSPDQSVPRELEAYAAVWAAALVAFEAADFREQDRETLLGGLLGELRSYWNLTEPIEPQWEATVLKRAASYFELRDPCSPLTTASRFVGLYLGSIGLRHSRLSAALAQHLCATFGYRILRDIYRLAAASRLRTAVISLVERPKAR